METKVKKGTVVKGRAKRTEDPVNGWALRTNSGLLAARLDKAIRQPAGLGIAAMALLVAAASAPGEEAPRPLQAPAFKAVQPGEHPRLLLFRKADLPKLREGAKTPEGQAILKRLRWTLNGGDHYGFVTARMTWDVL